MTAPGLIPDGPRFFVDAMLGKLARWLRTLGYDAEYDQEIDDNELVDRALDQERVILTRDTLLVRRRRVRGSCFFVHSELIDDQLVEVAAEFELKLDMARFLTRCLRCNTLLEEAEKASVRERVPPYVYETQDKFTQCPRCKRVYWAGTHRPRMIEDLKRLLESSPSGTGR